MSGSESKICVIKAINVEDEALLSTGNAKLDEALQGGLSNEGLVEITGESGCGKSQLCMQLALTVQYPPDRGGLGGGAVYICTEERFPSRRLHQLIQNFPQHYYKCLDGSQSEHIEFSDNIIIVHVSDYENLEKCMRRIRSFIQCKHVKLIILDSVTALFRGNYTLSENQKRAQELRNLGSILYRLIADYKLLVVCVNQVAQSPVDGVTVPALGLAWANLVTTRIMLTRNGHSRFMQVLFSPEAPSRIPVDFMIQSCGIV